MDTLELDADSFYICTEISPRNYVVQKAIQIDKSQIERMVGDLEKNAAAVAANNAANSLTQPPPPPIPYWFNRECKDKLMQVEPTVSDAASPSSSHIYFSSNFPPVPPIDVKQQLKRQLEYYFSRENLMTDRYLRCQMDSEQYVPITVIAGFRKITQLTNDYSLILEALRESSLVEVDERGEKVRPISKRTTIILREIEQEHRDEVEKMLAGGPKYLDLKYGLNDSWYVTYETEKETQSAYIHLQTISVMFNKRPMCARIKAGLPPTHVDQHQQAAQTSSQAPELAHEVFPPLVELGRALSTFGLVPVASFRPGGAVVHVEEGGIGPIVHQHFLPQPQMYQQPQNYQPPLQPQPQMQPQQFRYHSNSFGSDRDRPERAETSQRHYSGNGSTSSRNSNHRTNGSSYNSYSRGSYASSQSSSRNYEDGSSTTSARSYHNPTGGRQYREDSARGNNTNNYHQNNYNSHQNNHQSHTSGWRRGSANISNGGGADRGEYRNDSRNEYRNNSRRNGSEPSASHRNNSINWPSTYNPGARYPPLSSSSSSSTRQEPSEPATPPPAAPLTPVWNNPNRSELPPPPIWPAPNHSRGARKSNNSESSTTSNTNTISSAPTPVSNPTTTPSPVSVDPSVSPPVAPQSTKTYNLANHVIPSNGAKDGVDGAVAPAHDEATASTSENGVAESKNQNAPGKKLAQNVPLYEYEDSAFPCLPKPPVEPEKRVEKPTFSSVAAGRRHIKQIPESKKSYAEKLKERQLRST